MIQLAKPSSCTHIGPCNCLEQSYSGVTEHPVTISTTTDPTKPSPAGATSNDITIHGYPPVKEPAEEILSVEQFDELLVAPGTDPGRRENLIKQHDDALRRECDEAEQYAQECVEARFAAEEERDRRDETFADILNMLPDSAPCKFAATGASIADDVRDLVQQVTRQAYTQAPAEQGGTTNHNEDPASHEITCAHCYVPYEEDGWCDVIIPNQIWNECFPEDGMVCFRCITKRLNQHGKQDVPIIIVSQPYEDANEEWRLIGLEHGEKNAREERDSLRAELEATQKRSTLQEQIHSWADATFGQCAPAIALNRIDQELAEFFDNPRKEACDVLILLLRYAAVEGFDLFQSALDKMDVNKARTWVTSGNGVGQHTGSLAESGLHERYLAASERERDLRERLAGLVEACTPFAEKAKHIIAPKERDLGDQAEMWKFTLQQIRSLETALTRAKGAPQAPSEPNGKDDGGGE